MSGMRVRSEIDFLRHKSLERLDVSAIVAGFVDRRFGDEGGMGQAQIIQQDAEGLAADHSLADMLVAVQLRTTSGLGIVAMPAR